MNFKAAYRHKIRTSDYKYITKIRFITRKLGERLAQEGEDDCSFGRFSKKGRIREPKMEFRI
jgi:hypothetical protein